MSRYNAQILNDKGEYHLQFETDNKEHFDAVEKMAQRCIDGDQTIMAKHPNYNCNRGMLCPNCDKALWPKIEIKSIFGKKKITVKEQPNFCKYCGQALLPCYA